MQDSHFEYIVIGAGLMGAAAARYLTRWSNSVAVIGPAEPADQTADGSVFSSHYDQGRLTLLLSKNVTWSRIAHYAIRQYRRLEEESGIAFYRPVGRVQVEAIRSRTPESEDALRIAQAEEIPYTLYPSDDRRWQALFPYLSFPADFWLLHEPEPAGYINPRAMLAAQLTLAQRHGATLVRETVVDVVEESAGVRVHTDAGTELPSPKGAGGRGCVYEFQRPAAATDPAQAQDGDDSARARRCEHTAAELDAMPVVNYQIDDPDIDDIYMAPPIRYPDGEFYVKMGCNTRADLWPETLAEVQEWFLHGDSDICKPAMTRALHTMLPSVEFGSLHSRRCIVCYTPSGLPTIDAVSDRTYVVAGGNGSGAKGSDTLGRLAAGFMVDGRWIAEIEREPFRLRGSRVVEP